MPPRKKENGAAVATKKRKNAAPKSHQHSKSLPEGEILVDLVKKEWKLGKPLGSGGFGLIYLASPKETGQVGPNAQYVLKLEPAMNGPLFCELYFYQRAAKPDMISEWVRSRHLKFLGIPRFVATGMHQSGPAGGEKSRFLVMDRFGDDLQKLFVKCGKHFPEPTVYSLASILMTSLEYMHEKEYVHADIKAANLCRGFGKLKENEIYLFDFGLAHRYTVEGVHKPYKEDPRSVHNGTIEFTSRDAHAGVLPSRRGDLEITGYCILQWLCGKLPWEDRLKEPNYVRDQKIKFMKDIPALLKACFPAGNYKPELRQYLELVAKLGYAEKPDYAKCCKLFQDALRKCGSSGDGKLVFASPSSASVASTSSKRLSSPNGRSGDTKSPTPKRHKVVVDSEGDARDLPAPAPKVPRATGLKATPLPKNSGERKNGGSSKRRQDDDDTDDDDDDTEDDESENDDEEDGSYDGDDKSNDSYRLPAAKRGGSKKKSPLVGTWKSAVPSGSRGPRATPLAAQKRAPAKMTKAKRLAVNHTGTQTSPGLQGLKRSRKGDEGRGKE